MTSNIKRQVATAIVAVAAVTEAQQPERAAATLDALTDDVRNGRVTGESLRTGCRLSKSIVVQHVDEFGFKSDSSLLSNPLTHAAYRRLKFEVEGLVLSPDQVAITHADLIDELRDHLRTHPEVRSMSRLWRSCPALYRRVRSDPHARLIFWAAGGPRDRCDMLYWTDEQLLTAAAAHGNLSELKRSGGELHRHLVGRALLPRLCAKAPWMVGNFRVGLGGHRYRSQPELLLGNWLEFNKIPVDREFHTGLRHTGSTRSVVADFRLLVNVKGGEEGCLIELLQSDGEGRGERGKAYDERWRAKRALYEQHGQRVVPVATDDLFDHGVLDVAAFTKRICEVFGSEGLDIGLPPPVEKLCWEDCEEKQALLGLGFDDLMAHLRHLGAVSTAVLKNQFSWVVSCLHWRPDFAAIMARFKADGLARRGQSIRRTCQARRESYAPLAEVRRLCDEHGIRSQTQWWRFAVKNRQLLRQRQLPSNPAGAYSRLGTWTSWGDLWPSKQRER